MTIASKMVPQIVKDFFMGRLRAWIPAFWLEHLS